MLSFHLGPLGGLVQDGGSKFAHLSDFGSEHFRLFDLRVNHGPHGEERNLGINSGLRVSGLLLLLLRLLGTGRRRSLGGLAAAVGDTSLGTTSQLSHDLASHIGLGDVVGHGLGANDTSGEVDGRASKGEDMSVTHNGGNGRDGSGG